MRKAPRTGRTIWASGRRGGSALSLALLLLLSCRQPLAVDLVLANVVVVDVESGELLADRAVVVHQGLIHGVVPAGQASAYRAATEVDGAGGFLLPALADAHVHLQQAAELDSYLVHGVGLVINMAGRPLHLDLRQAVASGQLRGPTIVTAGPTLDGDPPTNPLFTRVRADTAGQVVAWVDEQGYDLVKVYQQMDHEALAEVIRSAGEAGRTVSGHVSRETGIAGALEAGQRYVAHGEELAFESFDEASRRFDRDVIPGLAARLADAGVTVTPMISYLENVPSQALELEGYLAAEPMRRMPAAMKVSFGPRQGWFSNRDEPRAFAGQMADVAGFVAELTAELAERDVLLVLGTDAGFGGAVPGHSAHQELESLVRAGLSNLDALRAATRNVGRYLRRIAPTATPWGSVAPGYGANLLLLAANPLQEIRATRQIEGVMVAGRWHGSEELAAIDRRLRQRQEALVGPATAFEEALIEGDLEGARRAVGSVPADLRGEALIHPDGCIFLGYRHYYGGRRGLAGQLYELCAEMHPDMAPLWIHIARAREADGDRAAAVEAYRRALDLNPWYGDPASAIGRLTPSTAGSDLE